MSMGAERAVAQPQNEHQWTEAPEAAPAPDESFRYADFATEEAPQSGGRTAFAAILVLAGLLWLGFGAYALSRTLPGPDLAAWASWIATLSAPLILLSLAWLIFGHPGRRETTKFTEALAAMRRESEVLEQALGLMAGRLRENRALLTDEAGRLMALGDEASDRLGRVVHFISRESSEMERKAQALDAAAESARVDIGVLMADLPRAEQQARAVAESMRGAGLDAHEQAAALEAHLAAITARSREADEVVGGAAQRLAAHVARIESGAGAAAERMDQAAVQMNAAVDGALARASDSVDQARSGLEAQGQAMLAMVEQGRAAFEHAGAEASRRLSADLDQSTARIDALATSLSSQSETAQELVARLSASLADLDRQLAALGENGETQGTRISQAVAVLRDVTGKLGQEIEQSGTASGQLIDRTHEMAEALTNVSVQVRERLGGALIEVEAQADRTGNAVQNAVPGIESIQAAAALAAESMGESEASLARQRESLDALLATVRDAVAQAEDKLRSLGGAVGETDAAAARLAQETGPQLIEALLRVRETANQAANHAREAIVAVIPDSAAALADASREAMEEAIAGSVEEHLAGISSASQRAMTVARQASERLTRQLLTMSETAAAIEDRIAEDRATREEKEAEQLTRRVTLLIEALNSTAIDVSKILSNDVADSAWAAYLKGDRGVFTRRAVRLLESGEAREIQRHYEEEPDFRDQVNRYVHDFETMLRRVLADRDGSALGVTLLSSDMGKLYVALAQAIDRLRR